MAQEINLKQLERKAWTSYFQDGFWDILIGLMMLIMGIRGLTDIVWFALMMLPAILVGPLGKKFITVPRIGLVKFGPTRKVKQKKLITVLGISIGVILIVLWLPHSGIVLPEVPLSPVVAIWIVLIFALVAYYMDFRRLFAYGLLFAISEMLWGVFGKPIGPIAFSVSGSAALLIGMVVLARFLRSYPLPVGEGIHGDR